MQDQEYHRGTLDHFDSGDGIMLAALWGLAIACLIWGGPVGSVFAFLLFLSGGVFLSELGALTFVACVFLAGVLLRIFLL